MESRTELVMGMPVTLAIVDAAEDTAICRGFARLRDIDARFSPYRADSEVSAFNRGEIDGERLSAELREVIDIGEATRLASDGYFDMRRPDGGFDPSGIVKGWAIREVVRLFRAAGYRNFLVDAGGDMQVSGNGPDGRPWRVGIRNPMDTDRMVKAIMPGDRGVATSGSYIRGDHIYDPHAPGTAPAEIVSLTVIAEDVLDADRFATAAFAMGSAGISFIESRPGLEGYAIDRTGTATATSGFSAFVIP